MKIGKKQKLLLLVPLAALPLTLLLLWFTAEKPIQSTKDTSGINVNLPSISAERKNPEDKMGYYKKAESDSAKWAEMIKKDPYYHRTSGRGPFRGNTHTSRDGKSRSKMVAPNSSYNDPNEEKVYRKLAELEKILDTPVAPSGKVLSKSEKEMPATDMERLELMMEQMTVPVAEDPELQQLSGMLETILDIQHPERVQHKLEEMSKENKGQVYAVNAPQRETPISVLDQKRSFAEKPGFYGLEPFAKKDAAQNTIPAIIHETQSLISGSTIKLRLVQDIYIAGEHIPKGNFVFGTTQISGERLHIKINGIRYKNSLFPVDLEAYGMDGNLGMHIPGAIVRKVAKERSAQTVQGLGFASFDNSLQAQAASAGVEATKNLLSRRAKLIKVIVKAGDLVLLKDKNQKNH